MQANRADTLTLLECLWQVGQQSDDAFVCFKILWSPHAHCSCRCPNWRSLLGVMLVCGPVLPQGIIMYLEDYVQPIISDRVHHKAAWSTDGLSHVVIKSMPHRDWDADLQIWRMVREPLSKKVSQRKSRPQQPMAASELQKPSEVRTLCLSCGPSGICP